MNKHVILFSLGLLLFVASCGPAAEDRKAMHERAKVFQDSIATVIRTSIAEAEGPAQQQAAPVITTATAAPASPTK